MCALDPDKVQITQYRDQRLNLGDQIECDISSKKLLMRLCILKGRLHLYFCMYDRNKDQSAYPECQHGLEWRHGRTVSVHLVNCLCLNLNRGSHKTSNLFRVMS